MNRFLPALWVALLLVAAWLLTLTAFAVLEGNDSGLYCREEDRSLAVIGVIPGSRWATAGFRSGDRITAIDGDTDRLLDRLYAVKIAQREGDAYRFTTVRSGVETERVYTAGPSTAPWHNSASVSILCETAVKLVYLGAAFYFFFLFQPAGPVSRASGALFLLLALLTPFFQLNFAYLCDVLGVWSTRALTVPLLTVCLLPLAVLCVGSRLTEGNAPAPPTGFAGRSLVAVSLLLYASFLYVAQDYITVLARGDPPSALVPIFSVFMVLNGLLLLLLVTATVVAFLLVITRLAGWSGIRRMPATNRLVGLLTLGLALPLLAGFYLMYTDQQFTRLYGLRKLLYLIFPVLYIHAVTFFMRSAGGEDVATGPTPRSENP
ncbi:MAG TPA: hypothetical protein PLN26_15120 [Acidobacteriota bacterium]|nr:hypothetical protein [Acidobacteriota bacterium]HQG92945.1 hypothetical protein [Acidobacteriota bacterium]HQK87773.1 hypothetical protein [Acidobacteriota bacterium]